MINFASGQPSYKLFPKKLFKKLHFNKKDIEKYYSYSPRAGVIGVREAFIKRWGCKNSSIENCLVVNGALGGIELIVKILKINYIFVNDPTFYDAIEIFKIYGVNIIKIPKNDKGEINFKIFEKIVKLSKENKNIIGIYIIPTLNNPDGECLDFNQRKKLSELCLSLDIICIEDDTYRELAPEYKNIPPLLEIAGTNKEHKIFRIFSLSKILMPGLRIGFIESNKINVNTLVNKKMDYGFSPVTCYIAEQLINDKEGLEEAILSINNYSKFSLNLIRKMCIDNGIEINHPVGGYFLWLNLKNINIEKLLENAKIYGVEFMQGKIFSINCISSHIRLCPMSLNKKEIILGMNKLIKLIKMDRA